MVHLLPLLPLLPTLGLACFVAPAPPTSETTEPAAPEVVEAVATVGGSGFQVVIDPVTGQIVNNPTDAELERLSEGVAVEKRRSAWELREFSLPGGGRGVFLDGWADHSLAVEVTAEGRLRVVCSQGDRHTTTTAHPEANER